MGAVIIFKVKVMRLFLLGSFFLSLCPISHWECDLYCEGFFPPLTLCTEMKKEGRKLADVLKLKGKMTFCIDQ